MANQDVRDIVDLRIDFIVQNVSKTTMQCHYDDGWGPSTKDPKGEEGLQDCLLVRIQLCARDQVSPTDYKWFDFSACLFKNQKATDTLTDHMRSFDLTVTYCAALTGFSASRLTHCAKSEKGAALLEASHAVDVKLNPTVDAKGHRHPDWVQIAGKDYGSNTTADWLSAICDAYTGAKPASCRTGA